MSVNTKEISVYGFLLYKKGKWVMKSPKQKLEDFCEFLNGKRKDLSQEIITYQPVVSEKFYWKRAQILKGNSKIRLKMYAEKVDSISHKGLTQKYCNTLKGDTENNSFLDLVRGMGFEEMHKREEKGVEFTFDLS